jgi:hypothetical protein
MPQTYYLGARSWFVTATAWLFIVLAVLACAAGVVQQATLASWAPGMQASVLAAPLAPVTGLLMAYLPWLVGAGLLLSVATLVAAAGLLWRQEWARRVFIGLLLLAIVGQVAGLWLQHELVQSLAGATLQQASVPAAALGVFGGFVTATQVMGALVTLCLCIGLGWIVRRLMSPMVRQEFMG